MNNIDIPISILEAGTLPSLQQPSPFQCPLPPEVTFLLLLLLYCVWDSNPCDKNENLIS